jgi:zinc transport system ATP-binding protein
MQSAIEVKDVCFDWEGNEVLHHIGFKVRRGAFVGLIGPNGSGKTTLIKVMLGLLKAHHGLSHHGEIKLLGHESEKAIALHRVGYVSQMATAFDRNFPATVSEVVAMGLPGEMKLSVNNAAIKQALTAVRMWKYKDKLIGELSGGEQQRVIIARALVGKPEMLILDEPTTGVDISARHEFWTILKQLNRSGLTVFVSSHDIGSVSLYTNDLIYLDHKEIQYSGPTKKFFASRKLATIAAAFKR